MTSRAGQPDTPADIELQGLLNSGSLPGFAMVAGAGSGKTTSIVKALSYVVSSRGSDLRRRTQKVACITYTEGAANEIFSDVGENALAHVSTVHSFLWKIVSPFQRDVRAWAQEQAESKLGRLTAEQAAFSSRVQDAKRDKTAADIDKLKTQVKTIEQVSAFRYGMATDFGRGVLGHEDVIRIGTQLLLERPLLAKLLARQFPFVFVDESQDTFPEVVESLKHVKAQIGPAFCLGFIGDPMQKVYPRGVGDIPLEPGWKEIQKPENFRSPRRVLNLMNHIRSEGDGRLQVSGIQADKLKEGDVFFFVLPSAGDRSASLESVRRWLDGGSQQTPWTADDPQSGAKILVIAHRMAARRLGFDGLYAALHDNGSSSLSQALDEGSAWPVKYFTDVVLPLARATSAEQISILRKHSPLLQDVVLLGADIRGILAEVRAHLGNLRQLIERGGAGSVGQVLDLVAETRIVDVDPRFVSFRGGTGARTGVVISDSVVSTLDAFVQCDIREIIAYSGYITEGSPFSTHQGVKGAEFPRVVVVLDDEEGRHNQFSYDKLLGIKELSLKDRQNKSEGRDSVIERTRRLLYVCASRSTEGLAIILYAGDVAAAVDALRASSMPGSENVLTLELMEAEAR